MFDTEVLSAYIVKACPELEDKYAAREVLYKEKKRLEFKETKGTLSAEEKPQIAQLNTDIANLSAEIKAKQAEVSPESKSTSRGFMSSSQVTTSGADYNTAAGFVTFKDPSAVDLALMVQIGENAEDWELSRPPEASVLIWKDLQHDSTKKGAWTLVGYALTAGLYIAYMPAVVGITQIATTINMGPLQPMWAAFAPTMGLQFMVAFLPTFLILIFRVCFTLKDDAFAQKMLQNLYFVFQLVFVILVTAIGPSMVEFMETLVESPTEIFPLLGNSMPFATHFYMNYLVLQWASHAMVLTRYIPLGKFFIFRMSYDEPDAARMAEPEDQDYYGIGSRSCRFTINLLIGIIYGTLSPPINLLTWVEFFICKYTYGYLLPYAETRKPDLGGYFWVQQLRHVFTGTILYCIVMTGVLLGRASTNGPGAIAAPALFYVMYKAKQLETTTWENLPYQELKMQKSKVKRKDPCGAYVQPWMQIEK
jgi:hypothetical protein